MPDSIFLKPIEWFVALHKSKRLGEEKYFEKVVVPAFDSATDVQKDLLLFLRDLGSFIPEQERVDQKLDPNDIVRLVERRRDTYRPTRENLRAFLSIVVHEASGRPIRRFIIPKAGETQNHLMFRVALSEFLEGAFHTLHPIMHFDEEARKILKYIQDTSSKDDPLPDYCDRLRKQVLVQAAYLELSYQTLAICFQKLKHNIYS